MSELTNFPISLGRDSSGRRVAVDIATASHLLICGEVRSGKSVLTYLILGALAGDFGRVRVAGIDPTGVLLGPFRDRFADPWIVLGTEDGQAMLRCLEDLVAEMDQRLRMLGGFDKISRFSPAVPLLVVVLEELPGIIRALDAHDKSSGAKPTERLAPRARLAIERLVSEAAKVGIRVLSLAQRPDADVLGGYARAQMPTRIALRMGAAEDFRMLFSDISPEDAAVGIQSPPGTGFIRQPGQPLRRFRADHVRDYALYRERVLATKPDLTLPPSRPAPVWSDEGENDA